MTMTSKRISLLFSILGIILLILNGGLAILNLLIGHYWIIPINLIGAIAAFNLIED